MKIKLFAALFACLVPVSFTACIDKDYDIDKGIDMTLSLGGDSLSVPFVNSLKIYLKDLIDPGAIDLISADADGYTLSQSGNIDMDIPKVDIPSIEDREIRPEPFVFSFQAGEFAELSIGNADRSSSSVSGAGSDHTANGLSVDLIPLHAGVCDTADFEVSFEMPDEIRAIDSLYLSDTRLSILLTLENVPTMCTLRVEGKIVLPEMFVIQDPAVDGNHCWTFTETVQPGTLTVAKTLSVEALQLSDIPVVRDFNLSEKVVCQIDLYIDEISFESIALNDIVMTPVISLTHIVPRELVGTVDVKIEDTAESFDFGTEISDLMKKGSYLDISPAVQLKFNTNLGIAIALGAEIEAVNGNTAAESTSFEMLTRASQHPSDTAFSCFWIAEDADGMPAGYEFVEASGLNRLVSSLPEELKFVVRGNTDKSGKHRLMFDADYFAGAQYSITVPMAFGENMKITYSDSLDFSLDEYMDMAYVKSGLEICGQISNTIPWRVSVTLFPLDRDKKELGLDPIVLAVEPGRPDGGAVVSKVSAVLTNKDGRLKEICGFRLEAAITSTKAVSHTRIRPENMLDLSLQLRVPGGVILDLNE